MPIFVTGNRTGWWTNSESILAGILMLWATAMETFRHTGMQLTESMVYRVDSSGTGLIRCAIIKAGLAYRASVYIMLFSDGFGVLVPRDY